MQFTVKNLKISRFASEETLCFEATVYVDGVKSFIASNHGHGGCNDYHEIVKGSLDSAYAWVKAQPAIVDDELRDPHDKTKPFTYSPDLDHYIDQAVNAVEIEKDIKKILKKLAIYVDGKIYTINGAPTDPASRAYVAKKYPAAVILNDLPYEEVLAKYKAKAA